MPGCHAVALEVDLRSRGVVREVYSNQFSWSNMCFSDLEGAFAIIVWWRVGPNLDRVYSQPLPRVTTPSSCLTARSLEVYLLLLHQYATLTGHCRTKRRVDDRFFGAVIRLPCRSLKSLSTTLTRYVVTPDPDG